MPIGDLKSQIARLPEQPGVYLYYNGDGDTLYVGKASVLRDRVRSYLGAHGTSPRIDARLLAAARSAVTRDILSLALRASFRCSRRLSCHPAIAVNASRKC